MRNPNARAILVSAERRLNIETLVSRTGSSAMIAATSDKNIVGS